MSMNLHIIYIITHPNTTSTHKIHKMGHESPALLNFMNGLTKKKPDRGDMYNSISTGATKYIKNKTPEDVHQRLLGAGLFGDENMYGGCSKYNNCISSGFFNRK